MPSYVEMRDQAMCEYAGLYVREEDWLDHLFLTNGIGYEWENGEPVERFNDPTVTKEDTRSIIAQMLRHGDANNDDAKEILSYWWDFHHLEYTNRINKPIRFPGWSFSYDWCLLTKVPDDVTPEWADAIVKCCDWIYICCIGWDRFVNYHKANYARHLYAAYYEEEKQMRLDNPEKSKKDIQIELADIIEEKTITHLTKVCNELLRAALTIRAKMKDLYETPYKELECIKSEWDLSKPDWYIDPADREGRYNREPHNAHPWPNILEELRKIPTAEELAKEEARKKIANKLIAEIIDEEDND